MKVTVNSNTESDLITMDSIPTGRWFCRPSSPGRYGMLTSSRNPVWVWTDWGNPYISEGLPDEAQVFRLMPAGFSITLTNE